MLATVINYCTNDYRYLQMCIDEAMLFSDQIIVVVSDHLFDGKPENRALLNRSYSDHPNVEFIEYAFDEHKPYGLAPRIKKGDPNWVHYWHSTNRYVSYFFLREEIEHVLFLDVDEIPDGNRFQEWLQVFPYTNYNALWLTGYFYFREATNRAKIPFRAGVLVSKQSLAAELLLDEYERRGLFISLEGKKLDLVHGLDGKPLIHHYSWVKTKDELKQKVCWGHHSEQNWDALIEEEFSGPFRGEDKIWGLSYDFVEPKHEPLKVKIPRLSREEPQYFPNVLRVNRDTLVKMSIDLI